MGISHDQTLDPRRMEDRAYCATRKKKKPWQERCREQKKRDQEEVGTVYTSKNGYAAFFSEKSWSKNMDR